MIVNANINFLLGKGKQTTEKHQILVHFPAVMSLEEKKKSSPLVRIKILDCSFVSLAKVERT